jgi:hypothetical protein
MAELSRKRCAVPVAFPNMADRADGVLLDSSVVIAYLRGRLDLRQKVIPSEPLFLPLVALGELYKGGLKIPAPGGKSPTDPRTHGTDGGAQPG